MREFALLTSVIRKACAWFGGFELQAVAPLPELAGSAAAQWQIGCPLRGLGPEAPPGASPKIGYRPYFCTVGTLKKPALGALIAPKAPKMGLASLLKPPPRPSK